MAISPFLGALLNAQQFNQQQQAQQSQDDYRQQQMGLQQAMQALQQNEFMQRVKEYNDAQPGRDADVQYKQALAQRMLKPDDDSNTWNLDMQNKMYSGLLGKMNPAQAMDATMAARAMASMTPEAYAHAKAAGAARDLQQAFQTQLPQVASTAMQGQAPDIAGAMAMGPMAGLGMIGAMAPVGAAVAGQIPIIQQQQAGMMHAPEIPGVNPASLTNLGAVQQSKVDRDKAYIDRQQALTDIGQQNATTNWQKMLSQRERYRTLDDLAAAKTDFVREQLNQLPLDAAAKRNMENSLATYRTGMLQLGKDKLAFEKNKEADANAVDWAKIGVQRAGQIGQIFQKAWTGLDGDAKTLQSKLVELDRSLKDPMFLSMATGYTDATGNHVPPNPVFAARYNAMLQHQQQLQQSLAGVGAMRDEAQAMAMKAGTVQLGTKTGNPNAAATNKAVQQLQNSYKAKSGPPQPFKVSNDAEYDAVPRGSTYIAPDGKVRVKQ